MEKLIDKSKECPKCKSINILKIRYGRFSDPTPQGTFEGGCILDVNNPLWHCADCQWEWGKLGGV